MAEQDDIVGRFAGKRIVVIGDVMIDAYIWGEVHRQSPEAPVPVVEVSRREARLGGAGNVALNIAALGATPIIATVSGDGARREEFSSLMEAAGLSQEGVIYSPKRLTTIKTRVIANDEHQLRVDEEQTDDITDSEVEQLLLRLRSLIAEGVDAIIFEDYNKGVLTQEVIRGVIDMADRAGVPTTVDPKLKNFITYRGCTLFKPNLKELREGMNMSEVTPTKEMLDAAMDKLMKSMPHVHTLITLSEHGVYYSSGTSSGILPAHERNIVDVSGAGDTVIATATLCLVIGLSIDRVADISNLAGGLVCEHVGVVPIDKEALRRGIMSLTHT